MADQYIPYVELPAGLDIKADEVLVVFSDITKLAMTAMRTEKTFVPSKFVDALKQRVKAGTLLFPAFVNGFENGGSFDVKNTLPHTGTLSVTAFKDPDFVRTLDPFHSFMVWGKHSSDLVAIKNKSTFGEDSVFSFLHKNKAKMLLIDIDLQHSFTFAHYVEEMEKVNYRRFKKYTINFVDANGTKENREVLFFEKRPGVMLNLYGLHELFKKNGALKEFRTNGSLFTIIDLEKTVEIIRKDIRSNAASNLHRTSFVLWMRAMVKKLIS